MYVSFSCMPACELTCTSEVCDRDTGKCVTCNVGYWGDSCTSGKSYLKQSRIVRKNPKFNIINLEVFH